VESLKTLGIRVKFSPSPIKEKVTPNGFSSPNAAVAVAARFQTRNDPNEDKHMVKRILCSPALFAALAMFLSLSAAAQNPSPTHPGAGSKGSHSGVSSTSRGGSNPGTGTGTDSGTLTGKEEPCISYHCLWYAGDYNDSLPTHNGLWNGFNPNYSTSGTVYVPFVVPKHHDEKGEKTTDWNVQGIFVNELLQDAFGTGTSVSSADWSIVQGVGTDGFPVQGKMITICGGTDVPTLTPTGRTGYGIPEYTLLITGIGCPYLQAGTYWMTLVPTTPDVPYLNDVEDVKPAHRLGPGWEPIDQSRWYSPDLLIYSFQPTTAVCGGVGTGCDRFSAGVIGTALR
jgi:hypothetical protein